LIKKASFALILGAIDRGIGRRVDDEVGHCPIKNCCQRVGFRKIELAELWSYDGAKSLQQRKQRATDLPCSSGEKDPH
jgi:hypothetical protein